VNIDHLAMRRSTTKCEINIINPVNSKNITFLHDLY